MAMISKRSESFDNKKIYLKGKEGERVYIKELKYRSKAKQVNIKLWTCRNKVYTFDSKSFIFRSKANKFIFKFIWNIETKWGQFLPY